MKNVLDNNLRENGALYIEEIFEKVSPFLSQFELWQLEQSAIFDNDKKILCRRILNDKSELEGYRIAIETTLEEYTLTILRKSVELTKNYCFGEYSFKEINKVESENDDIKITIKYQENSESLEYFNKIDEDNIVSFEDITEMLKSLFYRPKVYMRSDR